MDPEVQQQLLAFFKLLSDADRLRIVGALAHAPATAQGLAQTVGLKAHDVHRHLDSLVEAGLVAADSGTSPLVYRFQAAALQEIAQRILARETPTLADVAEAGDAYERKIVADFTDRDGRLKHLPAQHKKLMVVLRYVVQVFDRDARYSEREVNAALARFHEDTASLRRSLVDNRLMARANGQYWRVDDQPAGGA